jgi:CHAT domain-containing protein
MEVVMRWTCALSAAAIVILSSASAVPAQPADPVAPFRAEREAVQDAFRARGAIDKATLAEAARGLGGVVQTASGETRARALMELGTVLRISTDYQGAIKAQTEAARQAEALGLTDLAFDAWIGVARANENGLKDHGASATAFDRAVVAAGDHPSEKQRADLARYLAEFEIGRGELEAGVVDALLSIGLTPDPWDHFNAELDLADGLEKLAWRCDFRPLIDAKSSDDKDNVYGACRRAVEAARTVYGEAARSAGAHGWNALIDLVRQLEGELHKRADLIDLYASREKMVVGDLYHPHSVRDVLTLPAARYFQAAASGLANEPALARRVTTPQQIESMIAEAEAKTGRKTALDVSLLGMAKDMENAPSEAAQYYAQAARMLNEERSGFFDPRRRGTAIENNADIIIRLATRLLALGRDADAFAAFESVRARGLSEVALAMGRPDITPADRQWLAELLMLEAETSAIEQRIAGEMVAYGHIDAEAEKLQTLDQLRAERQAKLKANEAARTRFATTETPPPATLDALRAAAAASGVPVLLYWMPYPDVVAWYVGPDGTDVRAVIVPSNLLEEKVRAVTASASGGRSRKPFDETTARELFLYLLGPFVQRLNSPSVHEIMIVPQGALAGLPFEALVDPSAGASVIDRWAVSYAPNATMAAAALERRPRPVHSVAALIDPIIDGVTGESSSIEASGVAIDALTREELFAGSWRTDGLHILTHGEFDPNEALRSSLAPTRTGDLPIEAAQLTALPLSRLRVAVLSACKGGRIDARISGEIFGFPWALMAGGTEATVLSRWDVNGESNGKWMGVFYREVAAGAPVSEAAATAMREMRKSGVTHPYYWAAMQVSGR